VLLSGKCSKRVDSLAKDFQCIILIVIPHIGIAIQSRYVRDDNDFCFKSLYGVGKSVDYDACKLMVSESSAYVDPFQNMLRINSLFNGII
jgi:hypothetical protein